MDQKKAKKATDPEQEALKNEKRLISIAKKLRQGQMTMEQLKATEMDILTLQRRGYNIITHQSLSGKTLYYIPLEQENPYIFISGPSDKPIVAEWLELSDLHGGCRQFREDKLRSYLEEAVRRNIKYVHISGDVCDGRHVYKGQDNNLLYFTPEEQAVYMTSIFADYDLIYIAIKGNHEARFEDYGETNPLRLIEKKMEELGKKFIFLDSLAGDIIIGGIVKRMVHGRGGSAYALSYKAQTHIRELFKKDDPDKVEIQGQKYTIRALQMGHFHTEVFFKTHGMWITQPGNTQGPNDLTISAGMGGSMGCVFTKVIIYQDNIIQFTPEFISNVIDLDGLNNSPKPTSKKSRKVSKNDSN